MERKNTYGKKIELFLAEGNAEGLVTAELSNWNGKAIKIPRGDIEKSDREDIKGVGVYFLVCKDDINRESVYIGEAENIKDRLCQHITAYKADKEMYFWNYAIIFIGRDLNKALIRYLEDRLVKIAKDCDQADILTKNTYKTIIKEADKASMEEFIDNVVVLMSALGHKVLTPKAIVEDNTEYFYCKSTKLNANAKGFINTLGGITVLKGAIVTTQIADSFKDKPYYKLRQKLENTGIIVSNEFVKDYEFSSPSAAASVIRGHNCNGNNDWIREDGVKFGDVE